MRFIDNKNAQRRTVGWAEDEVSFEPQIKMASGGIGNNEIAGSRGGDCLPR